jgi:hypothetical protein
MNTKTLIAAIALIAVSAAAQAQTPESLLMNCQDLTLPTQHDVALVTGQQNFSQVYAEWQRIMLQAKRVCGAGADAVRIVAVPEQGKGMRLHTEAVAQR